MDFVDDGYTGSNFDRPGFQQMMDGVRNGKIDTIIVKDLSRFGRDYIGVGEYMEQIFPLRPAASGVPGGECGSYRGRTCADGN